MKLIVYLLPLLTLICCSQNKSDVSAFLNNQAMDSNPEIPNQKGLNFVVFSKEKILLSAQEIKDIELMTKKMILEYNQLMDKVYKEKYEKVNYPFDTFKEISYLKDYEAYKFQIVVDENFSSSHELWLNAFCRSDKEDKWLKQMIHVMDGGPCYFNFNINLKTKSYANVKVNGVA